MRATIVHESRGRMRLRLRQKNMTLRQADLLETWLKGQPWTREAVVHERTGCVIMTYAGDRETVLSAIGGFTWAGAEEAVTLPSHSTRELNREFQEKLVGKVLMKGGRRPVFCLPRCGSPGWSGTWYHSFTKAFDAWGGEKSRWNCWTPCPSASPHAAGTLEPPAPSCSCWRSASCWRIGRGRSPWPTWRKACPSMWIGCG